MGIENRWTIGNVVQLVGLVATIVSLGIAIGSFNVRMDRLEETARQSVSDSRTLIRVEERLAGIERSLIQLRSIAATGSISCPDSQPVIVASHCRSLPISLQSMGQ